jgi:UDP-glucuronate decarboxylase
MQKNKLDIIFNDAANVLKRVDFSPLEGKTVLITGATGLLGTHFLTLLALLRERGMCIKTFGMYHSEPADYTWEIAQRGNITLMSDQYVITDADVVIHSAGYAQPALFTKNPAETIRINTEWTRQLLSNLTLGGKFLFISSSEVYSGLVGSVTESSIGNTNPLHPRSGYIEGKRCGEAIVNAYRQAGTEAKSARLSLAYGPGTRKNDQRAMSQFIRQALTENKINLKFAGHEPRTFCYASDAVEMLWQVCLHGKQPVYNVAGDSVTDMASVAREIAETTSAKLYIPTEDTEMNGAPTVINVNISRVETEFGKRSFVALEDGLKRTIEWQRGLYV